MKNLIAAAVVTAAALFAGTQTVEAGDPCVHCHYKTIVEYKCIQKPVVKCITKYDHCGKPYEVKVVDYVTVKIPVYKQIKVCH